MTLALPLLPAADVRSSTDRFTCEPYHCQLIAGGCVGRQLKARELGEMGAKMSSFSHCFACEVGQGIAKRLGAKQDVQMCAYPGGCDRAVVHPGETLCEPHRRADGRTRSKAAALTLTPPLELRDTVPSPPPAPPAEETPMAHQDDKRAIWREQAARKRARREALAAGLPPPVYERKNAKKGTSAPPPSHSTGERETTKAGAAHAARRLADQGARGAPARRGHGLGPRAHHRQSDRRAA